MAENKLQLRSYEVSLWTLQDSFVTVLKASDTEHKGAIQDGILEIVDDGTEKLNFNVPRKYRQGDKLILNPLWQYILDGHIVANMHKIKLIFNKATDKENIFEFLITSVTEDHDNDSSMYEVACEGLAFHELGKIGYKISLSDEDFQYENEEWFDEYHKLYYETDVEDYSTLNPPDAPIMNIQYWNDKIFYYTDEEGNRQKKYQWDYILQMDWSDTSIADQRSNEKVYDEEYVASWKLDWVDEQIYPTRIEKFKEKSRSISADESNIYNITQDIAEKFGVYCKYVYDYDDNYHIIGKHVVYYNNNFADMASHIDITYPYNTSVIKRTLDNTELTTKLFVQPVNDSNTAENLISITTAEPNKSKEDYILNFDYLHKIHTITDEQYEAVGQFEYDVSIYNHKLEWILERIGIYENKITEIQANVAFYTNALQQDKERLNDANSRLNALTNGDAYIEITDANYKTLRFQSDPTVESIVDVNINLEGVIPATVKIYQTRDYKAPLGDGRLKDELTTGDFHLDEYGFLTKITNIHLKEFTEKPTVIYMTCYYSPQNYYQAVVDAWNARIIEDARRADEAEKEEIFYGSRLYGSDAGYARAGLSKVEFAIAGTSFAMGDEEVDYGVANGTYADAAVVEDAHGLYCMYDIYYLRKSILITKFERMMGPALREGYWTPDDYQDYGNQYSDYFLVNNLNIPVLSSTGNSIIQFNWDTINQFTNETKLTYEIGVDQEIEYYYVLDLSRYTNIVANNIDTLCLFYYDLNSLELYRELKKKYNNLQDEINALDENDEDDYKTISAKRARQTYILEEQSAMVDRARRWVTVGSQCTLAYALNGDSSEIIPILIINESSEFNDNVWLSLNRRYKTENKVIQELESEFQPYLGVINTEQIKNEDDEVVATNVTHVRLSPNITDSDILVGKKNGGTYVPNQNNHKLTIAQPRIVIDSLQVKEASVLLSLNDRNLTNLKDYSLFIDIDQVTDKDKYYLTIKPQVLMSILDINKILYINYNISNAAEEIYLDALKIAKENAQPKVSYDIELNAFNKSEMKVIQNYLRRVVYINDAEMQFDNVAGYISKLTLDLDRPWEDKAEIKNYETKFEDLFSTIVAQTESMKKNESVLTVATSAFASSGLIRADVIKNSMLKADLNYAFNQGTLTIDEKQGIWGTSDDGVIAIRGGGIFTATEKDENGEWKWNTGILPSGINADLITSGQLDTNRIRIYAGDKIAFQMNGEGIFAYRTDINEQINLPSENDPGVTSETHTYEQYMANRKNGIDALQYVTYNDNGLFLTALRGAKILTKKSDSAETNSDFITVTQEKVNRVEISWNGLILRNWNGENTFYADPEKGNLVLKGNIITDSGKIGTWDITTYGLVGDYLKLVSNNADPSENGIFLNSDSNIETATSITYNNEEYFAYRISGGTNDIYYLKLNPPPATYIMKGTEEDPEIIAYVSYPTTCAPLYDPVEVQEEEQINNSSNEQNQSNNNENSNNNNDNNNDNEGVPGSEENPVDGEINTETSGPITVLVIHKYLATDNQGTLLLINGEKVPYDDSDSLESEWYTVLSEQQKILYVKYPTHNVVLEPQTIAANTIFVQYVYTPTFSVYAQDGRVEINNGILGPFTLTPEKLSGGSSNDDPSKNGILEFVSIKNSAINGYSTDLYGRMIKNISGNSSQGTINFERVDGTTGNFNVADMTFYRTNISAAQALTLTTQVHASGANSTVSVTATTATSNIGTRQTKSTTVNIGSVFTAGKNSVTLSIGYTKAPLLSKDGSLTGTVRATASNGSYKDLVLDAKWISNSYNQGWNDCLSQCGIANGGTVYTGSTVGPVWLNPTSGPPSYSTVIANYTAHSVSKR